MIALDLPGHGIPITCRPAPRYHYIDYVRTVLAAADALQLSRFNLLGHSLGAGIASLVAAAMPERIERLLLIEGLGPLGDDGSHTLQRFRDALASARTATQAAARVPRRRAGGRCARLASGMQARTGAAASSNAG